MQITQDIVPSSHANRPNVRMTPKYITVHDTANPSAYADAEAHAAYLLSPTAARIPVLWHFTVDESQIIQHLPTNEHGWHAGDGSGQGNKSSIGVEVCENADGNRLHAEQNAAWLVAKLMREHSIPISNVVQHNKWTGKNCPHIVRSRSNGWSQFLKSVELFLAESLPIPQLQRKATLQVGANVGDDAYIIDNRVYVPLRYVAEYLGHSVLWDNVEKRATVVM